MNFAPIILFTYNRPRHTEKVLNALKSNILADQSLLYIFCDGPKQKAPIHAQEQIEAVRSIVKTKQWCKEVVIIERDDNLGIGNSVIRGVTEVIEKHGKVIVLEDDIITGKYFLKFMNEGLDIYQNEIKVFGISGFKFPTKDEISQNTYFLPISSSWSYATWSDRWRKINFQSEELLNKVIEMELEEKMNFGDYPYFKMLEDHVHSKIDTWDIQFYTTMFLEKSMFLYPRISLIKNIGFDYSGVHCADDSFFSLVEAANIEIHLKKQKICLNESIVSLFRKSFELKYGKREIDNWKQVFIIKKGKQILKKILKWKTNG